MEEMERREQLLLYVRMLPESGWVVGTSGNLSIRDVTDNSIIITPSGVDYASMKPEDLFTVRANGEIVPGKGRPTSSLAFHLAVMKARPDCMAILHTHAVCATAASTVAAQIPTVTLPSVLNLCGPIQVSPYAENGSKQEAENIVAAFGAASKAVLMQNHGVVSIGTDLAEAWRNMAYAEECCRVWLLAASTGRAVSSI